jgi:hypothetical protein
MSFLSGIVLRAISEFLSPEPPTTRRAGGLDFSAIGGKIQRHGSALIGASNTVKPWMRTILCNAPGLKTPNNITLSTSEIFLSKE